MNSIYSMNTLSRGKLKIADNFYFSLSDRRGENGGCGGLPPKRGGGRNCLPGGSVHRPDREGAGA